jgi:hypothetical protein
MHVPTPRMSQEDGERVCRDCGHMFRLDPSWFEERQLALPTRCLSCRAQRRLASRQGRIAYVGKGFGFIVENDGASGISSRAATSVRRVCHRSQEWTSGSHLALAGRARGLGACE